MEELIRFTYTFKFKSNVEKIFNIEIESETLTSFKISKESAPNWSRLENFACPHCPIDREQFEYCPVAVDLNSIVSAFKEIKSYEKVKIRVDKKERSYVKETDVQVGISSLVGVLMVTSGCPILGKLKPLARFHLPFAGIEETEFRVFSMYLLSQYIKGREGKEPDWEMKELKKFYDDLQILNHSVAEKITQLESKDSIINGVVVLNNFADSITFSLEEKHLNHLKSIFKNSF